MSISKEKHQQELSKLISKARKSIVEDLDSCVDWIDEEIKNAKKLSEQIEKMQRQIPEIDAKLFNDSRDCCDELSKWLKRLEDHRTSLLANEQRIVVHTLDELGSMNDGFRRSRKILFTK